MRILGRAVLLGQASTRWGSPGSAVASSDSSWSRGSDLPTVDAAKKVRALRAPPLVLRSYYYWFLVALVCLFFCVQGTAKVCTTKILEQNKTDEDIFNFSYCQFFCSLNTPPSTIRHGELATLKTEAPNTRTLQLARIANRHARLPPPRPSRRRRRGAKRLPPPLPPTGEDPIPSLAPAPGLSKARCRRGVRLQPRRRRGPHRGVAARGPRAGLGRPALPLLRAPPRRARRLPAQPLPVTR